MIVGAGTKKSQFSFPMRTMYYNYYMKQLLSLTVLSLLLGCLRVNAQEEAIVQEGEYGISAGASHYFGDLNPNPRFNRPNMALGAFFRKQFGNYVALRIAGHYAFLGYSDRYNTNNEFMLRRNLSFNTNIWELTLQGDFNFYKFVPGSLYDRFTPYITFGVGVFNYDPYAYYRGQKVYLRQLGTEGQGSSLYPGRKPYGSMAMCFPLGVGVKYNLNRNMNLGFEVVYRFTTTDYIDDVSSNYAPDAQTHLLPDGSPTLWYAMQDRSSELGTPIGIKGRQRGYSNQRDGYLFAEVMLSFNLSSYKCPAPGGL
jgi:opacity protein-like surface antigen